MDKCGHHNNRHYYFPVKIIAIYYNFIINFCHNYTDKEGPVMTTPTREELIIMYFFKGYPYKLIVEFLVMELCCPRDSSKEFSKVWVSGERDHKLHCLIKY